MTGKYRAYPEYTNSGIAWFGSVPRHWRPLRFKNALIEKRKTLNDTLFAGSISFGNVIYKKIDISEDTKSSYQELLSGEFLVNPLNLNYDLISLRTALSSINVVVSTGYMILLSNGRLSKNYIRWLLHEFDVAHMKTLGAGVRQTINYSDIGNSFFLEPTREEQESIANFLDYESAKIDTLIEKQQQLIALLKEKRQAVISHAVTKGLNPTAQMKDSGVEWLGNVPETWRIIQIRRVLPVMEQGKSPECENRPAEVEEWGVLKTSCVNQALYDSEANKALPSNIQPFQQFEVTSGDVLMSRASGSVDLIGSVAYVYESRPRILLSDKIFRLQLCSSVNRIFFTYLMQSSYMRAHIQVSISGAEGMANNITKSAVLGFRFALPPMAEQEAIISLLAKRVDVISDLIRRAESAICLMQERRTALISAAVTGKLDVRDWVAPKQEATEGT